MSERSIDNIRQAVNILKAIESVVVQECGGHTSEVQSRTTNAVALYLEEKRDQEIRDHNKEMSRVYRHYK